MSNETIETWSKSIAIIAVDALVDAGHISKKDFDSAVAVVEEEIFVRLVVGDYPPSHESQSGTSDS